jgi:hypothetical protein
VQPYGKILVELQVFLNSVTNRHEGWFHVSAILMPGKESSLAIEHGTDWVPEPIASLWKIIRPSCGGKLGCEKCLT